MARYPGAVWKPLPEGDTQAKITTTQLILHTAACRCGDSLFDDFNRPGNNLESHFYVQTGGGVEQYIDTGRRADANYKANVRAISVETQDDGDSTKPWADLQVVAIVDLIVWAINTHPGIVAEVCPAWDQPGLGHHTLFGAPGPWTPVAKSCPGAARKAQFPGIVRLVQRAVALPVSAPGILDDDMPYIARNNITGEMFVVQANTRVHIATEADVRAYAAVGVQIVGLSPTTVNGIPLAG